MTRVLHVVVGPERHGVTRHALDLLAQPGLAEHDVARIEQVDGVEDARRRLADLGDAALVHLHLTDHLLAPTAPECADVVVELAERRPVSLTLHDLPQVADGPGRYERRRDAYARMAAASRGVVVASRHEADLLRAACEATALPCPPVEVVPLPMIIGPLTRPVGDTGARRDLVVFGYVYPGKGHLDALAALADLPDDVGFTALGQVSPGHDALVGELQRRAAELGRRLDVTGYVSEDELPTRLAAAAVPVAPHRHISASGSINSWLAVGRRPLVPTGTYTDELDARVPGAVLRYGPGTDLPDLADAARAALDHPALTVADVQVDVDGSPEVAARLAETLDDWSDA